ncbi:hypothetical protein PMAC_000896 [Pneumocystis sp. 'macacae']|nr:hypothetical protein PMAC_000896 [Pneumocystis sp. 'macacae']
MTFQISENSKLIKNIPLEFLGFHGPITVLVFFNEFILFAGQGPYIKIYDIIQGFLIYATKILKKNKIHGIVYARKNKLVIWGGKDFCILNINDLFNDADFDVCVASEWIFDIKPSFDKSYICLTTSRNKVYIYDIQTKYCVRIFSCSENPLLYYSTLYIHSNGSITVASATIFNEIQIWQINPEFFNEKNLLINITHRLKGHEGIAFKVNFSNDGKLLCSCSDDRSIKVWDLNTGCCKATGWGHNSRVWDVKFINNDNSRLISVSEDTTARLWKMVDKSRLEQNSVFHGHEGKNVWCVSIFKNVFATGGNDGKIRLWKINDKIKIQYNITSDDVKNAINNSINMLYDTFRSYVLINSFQILIVSVSGNVLIFDIKTKKSNYLFYDSDLSSFSKVSLWPRTNFVNISDKFGNIYILDTKNNLFISKYRISDGKIQSLFPISYNELTAAVISFETNLIFLGFRTGFLSIHRLENFGKGFPSICIIDDLYKENALHAIILHSYKNNLLDKKLEITTIGRNWTYYILELTIHNHSNNKIQIEKKHHEKCNKYGIEGGFYLKGDLILYGFRKLRFFIWNQSKDFDIFSTICGGQHRHWSIYFSYFKKKEENSTFIFTRSNSIIACNFSLLSPFKNFQNIILQEGRHGREIRSMAFHPILYQKNTLLFLTGAEDTTVRLSKLYITKCSEIVNIYRFKQHTTGVEKILWSKNGMFFFSCGGAEEFVTWKFSMKNLNQIRIIDYAICPIINKGRNVRIMDFCLIELNKNDYLIIMTCSDSSIRIWLFQSKKSEYILISNEKYSIRCLLNVICISEKFYCYLLIASTDGFITIWDISNYIKSLDINIVQNNFFPQPIWKNQLHQLSIKSMILRRIRDGKYLLITGGDDNKINLTEIIVKLDSGSYKISCNIIIDKFNAHNSSITGLVLSKSKLLISIAIDQKLKIWKIGSSQLIFLSEFYTYVADPCGISIAKVVNKEILVVYGIGLEVFSFNTLISI